MRLSGALLCETHAAFFVDNTGKQLYIAGERNAKYCLWVNPLSDLNVEVDKGFYARAIYKGQYNDYKTLAEILYNLFGISDQSTEWRPMAYNLKYIPS